MDLSAQSSREHAADQIQAARPIGRGSSADRHAESTAQAESFQVSSGILQIDFDNEKKPSRKSSFVAESQVNQVVDPEQAFAPVYGGFFSPMFAPLRRRYFIIIARATLLIIALMWACLPVYWGALVDSAKLTGNLEALFIDRDGLRVGQGLTQAVQKYSAPGPQLDWTFIKAVNASSDDAVIRMVLQEQIWVAVVIQPNATIRLAQARMNGDQSYDPASAIKVYYSQARNEIATGNYIVPLTTQMLQATTSAYATSTAQRVFAQINSNGQPNSTALQMIANAPQTISPAISWTMVNLRPYQAPAAQAVTLVGNIFLCIFAFMITMANSTARAIVSPHMAFLPYLALRIFVPLMAYLPLSLSYALINLAFDLPLDTKFGPGAGFMVFWVYIYLGMAALGLSIEAMITILTPRFTPFFLFTLILYNVSPVVLPAELQNPIYTYGSGFPIWNLSQALRTIMFDTNSHLGRNIAVIVAWIIMSCGTMTVFTWYMRRREKRRLYAYATATAATKGKGKASAASLSKVEQGKEKGVE
ncbi:hypothetical protein C8Q70DRAFT_1035581 [Cubamyces menziesii]|uniref:DUF3533 domain-containing protein n=1 Tax=Trametes cubensis TaxID=1111947 RepID=A0AAD7U293_9APHY|nr:hypothetical protein C8Q70DRAFT_1035581 [Cubamyces menziesii]KAJ8495551.1 hypothetical protein ONZ51_g1648 [Trametes cubensis]